MGNKALSWDDISIKEKIGKGNAPVYKATLAGKAIAVKKLDCDKNEIPQEVEILRNLPPHPNVLPLIGVTHNKDGFSIYICMELADKSLHHYLHTEKKKPSLQQSTEWAMQIARGMQHIHQNGLAHRDLKSANVLLFEQENVTKLCDFGSARVLEHTTTVSGMSGTIRWMAPEFNDKASTKVNQRCDAFSYGMVLYEIFAHQIPFFEIDNHFAVATSIQEGKRPSLPPEVPLYFKQLMESCWKHEPNDRPTFEAILQILDLETQLHKAATSGATDEVKQLIGAHVNVNSQTADGKTALHLAAEHGNVAVVKELLGAHADMNLQDKDGNTALIWAAGKNHVAIVQLLLQEHADVSICDKGGLSPVYVASYFGNTEVVDTLLKSGANPNLTTTDGDTPLYAASHEGHTEVVDTLLKGGADPNLAGTDGGTALYAASQEGHTDIVDILLKGGADPNLATTTPPCSSPLGKATEMGHMRTVERLLEGGVNINYQDKNGQTALVFASWKGYREIVELLLQKNADVSISSKDSYTAMDVAGAMGHTDVTNLLKKYTHTH